MEKGKVKSKEKYISVLFIPHFSANVKSIKFSAVYKKLIALIVIIALGIGSMIFYTAYSALENRKLKNMNNELSGLNTEQKKLLQEKEAEVNSLKEEKEEFSTKAKDFNKKYRELTDSYISRGVRSDRTGDNSARMMVSDIKALKSLLSDINKLSGIEGDLTEDLTEAEEKLSRYLKEVPTLWPVSGSISSDFGQRRDPITGKKGSHHTGLDIAASYGSSIKAAASGKVVLSDRISVYGRSVMIDHGHGIKTFYGHASKLLVKEGQEVKKGDVIAKVGSSGRSTGAHLHFEIRVENSPVDPLKYLD
ncbi:MAG: peptidoglycan DD-metalloendopeptidase family protein [Clostridia bacterium]|nr:peptidoglycan DD-metalloendopeptidase family protein [Clostridia bacterium]